MIDYSILATLADDTRLRPYQQSQKENIYKLFETCKSIMLQMPTGTGKTRLFTSIVNDIHRYSIRTKKQHKVLILAHRIELIEQISQSVGQKYNLAHGLIIPKKDIDKRMPTQIASVQTLNRRLKASLKLKFDLIIIDEAHHAVSESYVNICNHFPDAKLLGVTATPYRLNGSGFRSVFDDLIISPCINEFIANGWLSDYVYYSIKPNSAIQRMIDTIDKFDIDGDYAESYLNKHFNVDKIRAGIVENYQKYAKNKKGIVYTINIDHNKKVCEAFNKAGIKADYIDSNSTTEIRKDKVRRFRQGEIDILCNVNIFSEGFDCPDIEFIQLARPTQSLSLYLQQVGRGFRIHAGKSNVIFIDNVGLYNKFGIPSSQRKWRHHFDGYNHIPRTEEKNAEKLRWIEEKNFSEGNEEMMEIFSINTNKDVSSNESNESSDIIIIENFPVLKIYDALFIDVVRESFSPFVDVFYSEEEWDEEMANCMDFTDKDGNLIASEDDKFESERFVKIQHDGLFGILDRDSNELVLDAQFTRIERIDKLNRFIVERDGKVGLVEAYQWQFLVNCEFDKVELDWNDFFVVSKNNKYGVIRNRSIILPIQFDEVFTQNQYIFTIISGKIKMYGFDFSPIKIKSDLTEANQHNRAIIYKLGDKFILINKKNEVVFPFIASKIRFTKSVNAPYIFRINAGIETKNKYFLLSSKLDIVNFKTYYRIIEIQENSFIADNDLIDSDGTIIHANYITKQNFNSKKLKIIEKYNGELIVTDKREEIVLKVFKNLEEANSYISEKQSNKDKHKTHQKQNLKSEFVNKISNSQELYKDYAIKYEHKFWIGVKNGDVKTRIVCQTKEQLIKKINQKPSKNNREANHKSNKNDRLEEVYYGYEIWSNKNLFYALDKNKKCKFKSRDLVSLRYKIKKI